MYYAAVALVILIPIVIYRICMVHNEVGNFVRSQSRLHTTQGIRLVASDGRPVESGSPHAA